MKAKMSLINIIDQLKNEHYATEQQLYQLIVNQNSQVEEYLHQQAQAQTLAIFGKEIYLRGLIEFTNYCKNDCLYCGIRRSNSKASRYRLTTEEILACCHIGYTAGLRTFVLQGGEDFAFDDNHLTRLIVQIKELYPDCALTLSAGERPYEQYRQWRAAGADRYLLRHETALEEHYRRLHPPELSLAHRLHCLEDLMSLGYQVGMGFMVGSPFQTTENLLADLLLIKKFRPQMVGIGPFIPHCDTPFRNFPAGSIPLTLKMLSLLRLLLPSVLLPATTALNTVSNNGHQLGIEAGANVIMPNLSPQNVRSKYALYNNKRSYGQEAAEGISLLKKNLATFDRYVSINRGDYQGDADE